MAEKKPFVNYSGELKEIGSGDVIPTLNGGTGVTVSDPVLQRVFMQTGAVNTGVTLQVADDTIPQITEGNEYMTLAITPKSATSKLVIKAKFCGSSSSGAGVIVVALHQDAVANALTADTFPASAAGSLGSKELSWSMTSGTTSSITFRIRAGGNVFGTTTFNGSGGNRFFGGVYNSYIEITEYAT